LVGAAIWHDFVANKMRVIETSWTGDKVATVCQMCAIAWVMLQLRFMPLWVVVMGGGREYSTLISWVILRREKGGPPTARPKVTRTPRDEAEVNARSD